MSFVSTPSPIAGDALLTERERLALHDPQRLAALYRTNLLDVPDCDELQRLTRMAVRQLGVAVAMVSLVDRDRQYFTAATGLEEPYATTRQTGIDSSFCRIVVTSREPLVVTDARLDERVSDNSGIAELGIIAYAGVPIIVAGGHCIGAFCAISHEPRSWSALDLETLHDFAAAATSAIDRRITEAELQRAVQDKLDLVERITESFVSLDREWRVTFANDAAARLAQRDVRDAIGHTLWELVPALAGTHVEAHLRAAMENPGVHELEWKGVANPGWLEMRALSSAEGISLYIRDITSRKEAERELKVSESRYRRLTEIAPVGIFETDATGQGVWVNRRWSELTGVGSEELRSGGWARGIHPDDLPMVMAKWAKASSEGSDVAYVCRRVLPNGSTHWVSARATPMRDASGVITGYLGTTENIDAHIEREQQLQEVVATFEAALRGSDIGMWDWHLPSGKVKFSPQVSQMLGYAPEEFGDTIESWRQLVHPDEITHAYLAMEEHFARKTPYYRCPHRLRAKDGTWRWILDAGAVVERDVEGRPVRMLGTHVDITEAKSSEARFRLLFEKSNEPLLLADERGVLDCNDAAVRALGAASHEELIGPDVGRLLSTAGRQAAAPLELFGDFVTRVHRFGAMRFDWTLRRMDGCEFPVEISLTPMTHGDRRTMLASWHDLSVRHEQARMLRESKEAAERANQAKSDFLARMSHELRSPLNSVIGFSRLLLKSEMARANSVEKTYLERIQANGVHLLSLINNVLDIARIEAGHEEINLARTDLCPLIRQTVAESEGQLGIRPIVLCVEVPHDPVMIEIDAHKLRQVVINLVGNALKFTNEGSVTVRVLTAPTGDALGIEVADTGIGIPADRLTDIFEPFEQVESGRARRFDGSGLGLAISRQLCEVMGCSLSVRSTLGVGSTFTITFATNA